jgi:hypothetical protein
VKTWFRKSWNLQQKWSRKAVIWNHCWDKNRSCGICNNGQEKVAGIFCNNAEEKNWNLQQPLRSVPPFSHPCDWNDSSCTHFYSRLYAYLCTTPKQLYRSY